MRNELSIYIWKKVFVSSLLNGGGRMMNDFKYDDLRKFGCIFLSFVVVIALLLAILCTLLDFVVKQK